MDQYYHSPYFRPVIRSNAFNDKQLLLVNLARYFEPLNITKESVSFAQDILKMIPRSDVIGCSGLITGTKILDIYYAMPVEERHRQD